MRTYEVNIPKSDNYSPSVQRMMAEGYTLADKIVKVSALSLYHRMVICENFKVELTDESVKTIYDMVEQIADDVDLVDDVCPLTHRAMMSVSRVYSYSEGVMRGDDILEAVCELLGDYLTEKLQETAPNKIAECYFVDKEDYIQVFIYDEEDEYTD